MMIVDCMTCPVRGHRCDGCVATVLFEVGPAELPLDAAERRVLSTFVGAGLVSVETAVGLFARYEPRRFEEPMPSAQCLRAAGAVG